MKYTPIAILVGLWLEATNFLLSRWATHVREWEPHPEFRVFQYGTRIVVDQRTDWFFILKLPSWQWMQYDFGRCFGWHQLHLMWSSSHGWEQHYVRDWRQQY